MTTATLRKKNISLRLAYSFRGLVHSHHGGKHDSIQADIVLEKELKSSMSSSTGSKEETACTVGIA